MVHATVVARFKCVQCRTPILWEDEDDPDAKASAI